VSPPTSATVYSCGCSATLITLPGALWVLSPAPVPCGSLSTLGIEFQAALANTPGSRGAQTGEARAAELVALSSHIIQ
jgi:hypothetical protein